jgi:hypothetical protein
MGCYRNDSDHRKLHAWLSNQKTDAKAKKRGKEGE